LQFAIYVIRLFSQVDYCQAPICTFVASHLKGVVEYINR